MQLCLARIPSFIISYIQPTNQSKISPFPEGCWKEYDQGQEQNSMFKVLCDTGRSAPKKIPGASEVLFSSSSVVGNTVLESKVLSKSKGLLNATHELRGKG